MFKAMTSFVNAHVFFFICSFLLGKKLKRVIKEDCKLFCSAYSALKCFRTLTCNTNNSYELVNARNNNDAYTRNLYILTEIALSTKKIQKGGSYFFLRGRG